MSGCVGGWVEWVECVSGLGGGCFCATVVCVRCACVLCKCVRVCVCVCHGGVCVT
jgi:hypothetical protein